MIYRYAHQIGYSWEIVFVAIHDTVYRYAHHTSDTWEIVLLAIYGVQMCTSYR